MSELERSLRYLEVVQIADSTFPIGTFNHSFGMENYLNEKIIHDTATFEEWITNFFKTQFRFGEGLLVHLVWQALETADLEAVWRYDWELTQATLARETRTGTKLIAKQMLALIRTMYGDLGPLDDYEREIAEGRCSGNPAVVFTIFAYSRGLSFTDTFLLYGYSIASTMVQNAVRAVPLGQRDGQIVLRDLIDLLGGLEEKVLELDESYLGANLPGIEMAQILHETQTFRLFMS